jgi:hypothetical protein
MHTNSKEAPLSRSDNVSKQLKYDDDKTEDSGRLVKVNKEEKKKKTEQKMYEYNDESAAEKLVASKKFVKSSNETQPKDESKNIDLSTTLNYNWYESNEAVKDSTVETKSTAAMSPSSAGDVYRDERHVPANDASSA